MLLGIKCYQTLQHSKSVRKKMFGLIILRHFCVKVDLFLLDLFFYGWVRSGRPTGVWHSSQQLQAPVRVLIFPFEPIHLEKLWTTLSEAHACSHMYTFSQRVNELHSWFLHEIMISYFDNLLLLLVILTLFGFYGMSTFEGFVKPPTFLVNEPFYINQFSLAWAHSLSVKNVSISSYSTICLYTLLPNLSRVLPKNNNILAFHGSFYI